MPKHGPANIESNQFMATATCTCGFVAEIGRNQPGDMLEARALGALKAHAEREQGNRTLYRITVHFKSSFGNFVSDWPYSLLETAQASARTIVDDNAGVSFVHVEFQKSDGSWATACTIK